MERDEDEVDAAELRIDEKPKLLSILRSKEEEEEGVVGDTEKVIFWVGSFRRLFLLQTCDPIFPNQEVESTCIGSIEYNDYSLLLEIKRSEMKMRHCLSMSK